jgi:hypothetical protein
MIFRWVAKSAVYIDQFTASSTHLAGLIQQTLSPVARNTDGLTLRLPPGERESDPGALYFQAAVMLIGAVGSKLSACGW